MSTAQHLSPLCYTTSQRLELPRSCSSRKSRENEKSDTYHAVVVFDSFTLYGVRIKACSTGKGCHLSSTRTRSGMHDQGSRSMRTIWLCLPKLQSTIIAY